MSSGEEQQSAGEAQAEASVESSGPSLLDQAISAHKQTDRNKAEELIRALVEEANAGTIKFDKNVTKTINAHIGAIDAVVSKQLATIMHNADFQKLEGSWRGLSYLVHESETSTNLKLRVLNVSKTELKKDFSRATEFDQSETFKRIYSAEFDTPGGTPYGCLIGDYAFENHPEDIDLLTQMSSVAAGAFAPFITAPSERLFGFDSWEDLSGPRDLAKIFDSKEYIKWRSFRESEDSRFVTMAMPRTLSRLPYGAQTKVVEEFGYEEVELGKNGEPIAVGHDQYCWMNAAYVLGARITDAFAKYGWCTAIRGAENGGMVEGLPTHIFKSDKGDVEQKCPTEIAITDRRENELSELGFLPLCHYKDTDYSVFFGAQTTQKPKKYDKPTATANAAISARLPYILASSRMAHFLKVIARDKIGSFMEREDCQKWLENWISRYVSADKSPAPEQKARYPLAEAQVEVNEVPGSPGEYSAVLHMRPWLQLEKLSASLRMVASLPRGKK